MELDHLAVAGETLDAAVAHIEEALGVEMLPGGKHDHFGTYNRLLGLGGGLYLEAIAIDPEAEKPGQARWFDLDRFSGGPRLQNWICRVTDMDAALAGLDVDAGVPVALRRGDLRWRMAVPGSGVLPFDNCFPALIQWDVAVTPAELLAPSGCSLRRLEVAHPQAASLRAAVALDDARVVFVEGESALRAAFDTPHGVRVLA
ncbi:VOC family protein [Shimia aestuarii]|uniref:Glyoxalase-like domain-containing protein n=1 Tax=Shimia aestuarii TaxID=254406 RepID=A0A1I4RIJ8_9RHOB|nr:VOC family protein [Shimia aestuarii]SFM52088.1 Glyoxalase-like domain-containing protein [Shimia aestuarii]